MSAYVVEDKTINQFLSKLYHHCDLSYLQGRLERDFGFGPHVEGQMELGRALAQLNVDSVNQRYQEQQDVVPYQHHYVECSLMQAYKSLKCWIYQSCEGDCTERPLFQFFENDVKAGFADAIIRQLPAWDTATWG
jgi:hypothetical protein